MREAAEYGADAVIDVRFEIDDVKGHDIDGVALRRVTATGLAVRFARAAGARNRRSLSCGCREAASFAKGLR